MLNRSQFEGSLILSTSMNYFVINVHTLCILHGKVAGPFCVRAKYYIPIENAMGKIATEL